MAVRRRRKPKGQMLRDIVADMIRWIKITAAWAMGTKTLALLLNREIDLSDVLIFAAAGFCGELAMSLGKRLFAKPKETETMDYGEP